MNQPVSPRSYFAARKKGPGNTAIDIIGLVQLIKSNWDYLEHAGYFVEAFGFHCVDSGFEPGYVGSNVEAYVRATTQQLGVWPIDKTHEWWEEDEALTMVEFLYDHVSKPRTKNWHDWNNCGYHYSDFDREEGRKEFRERMNLVLARYGSGWELSEEGEVLSKPPQGMTTLLAATPPTTDTNVTERVANATIKFRRHGSTISDREDAVRDLAGVLEWLRPQIKETLLKDDESELFNIANNFGIRHMNQKQKLQYDKAVWLSWMFYHYLNTINAFLHILKRQKGK